MNMEMCPRCKGTNIKETPIYLSKDDMTEGGQVGVSRHCADCLSYRPADECQGGITTPVIIQQHEQELAAVLEVYRALNPLRVLEIGSLYGGTLYHWITEARPGAVIASIDLPNLPDAQAMRDRWQEWADEADVRLLTKEADSRSPGSIAWARKLAPFDFIFADGNHAWSVVEQDFSNYFPMLRPGGVMAFHDICAPDNHPVIGAGRWWRELKADGGYRTEEIVRDGNPDSAGIGLVWREA